MSAILIGLAVVALVIAVAMKQRGAESGPAAPLDDDEGIDHAALEQAEREVRDMEANPRGSAPDEAAGDDWGPGTPKASP